MGDRLIVWKLDTKLVSMSELFAWCSVHQQVDHMLLAMRLQPRGTRWQYASEEAGQRLRQLFGPFLVTSFHASAWPGTDVIGSPGLVSVIRFNEVVKDLMLRTQPDLEKWLHYEQPSLPEDICLFKETDSHPSFISVTHDGLAWLITNEQPDLPGVKESMNRAKDLFFGDQYFCRKYKKPHHR